MVTTILATKLFSPPMRSDVVKRPRLVQRLNEGLHVPLTLVCAPAGFGKTTLVSNWLTDCGQPATWLSLDEADKDLARFLTYLVTALQRLVPSLGAGVLGLLQSSQPVLDEAILTTLVNEIATVPEHFVLVLDDYHLIDATLVDNALLFLLEHLPPQMHIVMTTREDPAFPLARFRVRGQLIEVRIADLRFTPSEATEFLNQVMGLDLAPADIATLETRTEGWIAGLQLAALSVQGQLNVAEFIRGFAGDNRYVVDYLVEEVLQRQPEHVRSFLLQTAILDRMNGPLCDAVTGQQGGSARLEALKRGNYFVIPLDDKRHWYRYHHLFADVLAAHLREEQSGEVAGLHRRASAWFEQNNAPAEAIRHALAAGDFERAARLIEQAAPATQRSRQEATLLDWLRALPETTFRDRPVLSVYYAGTLLQSGIAEGVEARLRDAERWLEKAHTDGSRDTSSPEPVVVDAEDARRLPANIALYHAAMALMRGDNARAAEHSQKALGLARDDDQLLRASASGVLGLAYWTRGDLAAGHRWYTECRALLESIGHVSDVLGCSIALADMRMTQGRLRDAMATYERGLHLANGITPAVRGVADMHVGLSTLYCERNDLPAALKHLQQCSKVGEVNGLPQNPYRWRVAMARIREADGDLDGALDLLTEAERLYVGDFSPNVRPIPALTTRIWIALGRVDDAVAWARGQGLSAQNDLSYLREFEHITLARVLMARAPREKTEGALAEALELLERLLQAAEEGGRTGSVIEILALQALAYQMQGAVATALAPLQRALALAEPEGYVRIFIGEGQGMASLLGEAAKRGIAPDYVHRLRAAFGDGTPRVPVAHGLVDPLSEREMVVLRLLATDMSGPEIAQRLVVSLSTLRTHTKNIYSKLAVNSRRAAVRRAEEFGLV